MFRLSLLTIFTCVATTLQADDFFTTKIEPLLREHCFECHSHEHSMEAGLALDSRSGWEQGGDSGAAVRPGKVDESLLIRMIRWADDDHQMPPSEKLPNDKIALLERWVEQGAPDPRELPETKSDALEWWSLRPAVASEVPKGVHPIDYFVSRKLAEQNLQPSPRADRRTLMRRLKFDLHGMLPTPEEVAEFEAATNDDAWLRLVNESLASPRYGERWARHWLDVIHFADSHGCEHDVKRPNAWRFRDYVVARLNADVSWGRFVREQLAPDVFFPNMPQLMVGLGFVAAGPLELSRAGTAPVAFDYLDRDDIVTQTMAAFTSTTANCARCHTHKFDPITQEDYYALQAVFAGVGKGDIEFDISGDVLQRRMEWTEVLAAADRKDSAILLRPKYAETVKSWVADRKQQEVTWTLLNPDVFISSGGAILTRQEDGSLFATGPMADTETYTLTSSVDLQRLTAVKVEALRDDRLPMGGPGRAANGNLHVSEVSVEWFPANGQASTKLKIAHASADFDQVNWTSKHAIDGDLKTGWAIHPNVNQSHHIVFELSAPLDVSAGGKLAITLKQLYPPKHYIGRLRLSATDAESGAARILPTFVSEALAKPEAGRSQAERAAIAAVALAPFAAAKLAELPPKQVAYGVSRDWSHAKKLPQPQQPKVVHLLRRGAFDKPVREVASGALSSLTHLPARFELANSQNEASRRAALADWIAHSDNPLTWRSIVNRVWHYHFGRGLCDTPNDFGRMGSQPSHPELLDWLAVWFRDEAEGSLKQLHRLILTSETWKQRSDLPANADDADNRLLWRMNRRRLDAEAFRDSALQISGRLDLKRGGPGIEQFVKTKGPQATPALDYSAYDWNSQPKHRRSIYRVVWRGIADPFMEAIDFPDLALLTPKRGFSVSALQSLSLYNNDFVLHAAEWIAVRIESEAAEENRVRRAVELCWQRRPTEAEHAAFRRYVTDHSLAALCRVLLNSNEFLFVD